MAKGGFNTLVLRGLTGAVFVGIIVASLLYSSYASFVVFGVAMFLSLKEFLNMVTVKGVSQSSLAIIKYGSMCLYALTFLYATTQIFIAPIYFLIPFLIVLGISELFNKDGNIIKSISSASMALVYIVLPFSLVNVMINKGGDFYGAYLLVVFVLIWANDSFAYLFGVSFGKHRLWERISPKKSWEGLIGGVISTVIVAWVIAHFFFPSMTLQFIGLALIVSFFGTFGDLFESQLKRQSDVKDSGTMLPGHGGFLDRFDSFLFIIPVAMIYLQFVAS